MSDETRVRVTHFEIRGRQCVCLAAQINDDGLWNDLGPHFYVGPPNWFERLCGVTLGAKIERARERLASRVAASVKIYQSVRAACGPWLSDLGDTGPASMAGDIIPPSPRRPE